MPEPISPDMGPRPGAEQAPAAPKQKTERHPIKAAGEILRAAKNVLEERKLRQMSTADREKALREREKKTEAENNARVDVQITGSREGLSPAAKADERLAQQELRDSLSPEVRERVRQAQQELVALQKVDVSTLSGEERVKKLQELRSQARVVVAEGGKQIMLIQGDQNGYDVDPQTGKITLKLIKENVEETVNGVKQTKQIERNSQIQVARASFETSEEKVRGRTVKVEDVRYLRSTEPSLVTLDKAGDGNGNAFAGLGEQMVTVKLSKMDIAGTRVNIVDVGKADVDSSVRALRAVADAREKSGRSQAEITIAGAGADLLKVGDRKGKGVLELGNITSRSQIEAPKAPPAPGAPAERQTIDLVLTEDEQRQFNQLPREQQVKMLGEQAGALPTGVDTDLLDFAITVKGTGEIPEDAVSLNSATQEQLHSLQATALHTTKEILAGRVQPADAKSASELALMLGRGTTGYDNPATAMQAANAFVETIQRSLEAQVRSAKVDGPSRQEMVRSLIDVQFPPTGRSEAANQAVNELVSRLAGPNNEERRLAVENMPRKTLPSGQPEEWSDFKQRGVAELMRIPGMTQERAEAYFNAYHEQPVVQVESSQAVGTLVDDFRNGRITREQALERAGQAQYADARTAMLETIDFISPAVLSPDQQFRAIGDRILSGGFASRDEALMEIARVSDPDVRQNLTRIVNNQFAEGRTLLDRLAEAPTEQAARRMLERELNMTGVDADNYLTSHRLSWAAPTGAPAAMPPTPPPAAE